MLFRIGAQHIAVSILLVLGKAVRVAEHEPLYRRQRVATHLRPEQRLLGERGRIVGNDAAQAECLHHGVPDAIWILRAQIGVRGQHRAQEIAEREVDRRRIIECTRADGEELLGGAARLAG